MKSEVQCGEVVGVCISARQGTRKTNIGEGTLVEGYGMLGDAHAGTERQISALSWESMLKKAQELGVTVKPGDFAENLTVKGIDLNKCKTGLLIEVGEAVLRVKQIGKAIEGTHTFSFHGEALLVTEGVFCDVVRGGRVKVGDPCKIKQANL